MRNVRNILDRFIGYERSLAKRLAKIRQDDANTISTFSVTRPFMMTHRIRLLYKY